MSNVDWFRNDYAWDKVAGANFMNLKNRPWKTKEDVLIFSKVSNFTYNPIRVKRTEKSLKRDPVESVRRKVSKKDSTYHHYGVNQAAGYTNKALPSDGKKHPIDIIRFSIRQKGCYYGGWHGTRKPVPLFEYLIRTYTNKGDTVLDNVIGSGSTGVAAFNTGRRFIGMEKDLDIYKSAVNRIKAETCQRNLFNESFF